MKIQFLAPSLSTDGLLVVGVTEGRGLTVTAAGLDGSAGGTLTRAMGSSRFQGKKEQKLTLLAPAGLTNSVILLIGLGKSDKLDALAWQAIGAAVAVALQESGESTATVALDVPEGAPIEAPEAAANFALGLTLRSYRFDKYRTKQEAEEKPCVKSVAIMLDAHAEAKKAWQPQAKLAEAVAFTRDLVSEPANVIYPETLAHQAESLTDLGVEVEVLHPKEMRKLGMGALLGVAQGSAHEPRLVVMQWQGAKSGKPPIAFVGKGVTFDSGGISIKPAEGMEEMKWDMGGAGVVIGLMRALAARKAKVNVVGVVGLVENMPSGTAQRPGDVVHSMSGQTIEVINTDAEGRLVLADALHYTLDRFKPKAIIDLATLTGAIIIALGHDHAGLFANDDELAERLVAAGKAVGEPLWRLPMGESYDKQIKSEIADMKNTGGRPGGSITAAQFLARFIDETPWAHIDIAGVAWAKKDATVVPKGASGFGVRLLERLIADYYEK